MRRLLPLLALLCAAAAAADDISLPPGARPVPVEAGFYLVNLSHVAERDETFQADLYLSFCWHDARLAGPGERRFLDEAAVTQLGTMWWPQLEFVNTAAPTISNRNLAIAADGTVRYVIGLTSDFRADLDLRRFPFDRQQLEVRIESFTWTREEMTFVADQRRLGFNADHTFEGLAVEHVAVEIRDDTLAGWEESFSQLVAVIEVRRHAGFYLWTVMAPVALIFLISCAVFVVDLEQFSDRISISLTALLACVATQFAISFNLPQISYLTLVDQVFLVTYFCVALGVLVSTGQMVFLRHRPAAVRRVNRIAGLGLPLLFLALVLVCLRAAGD